LTVRTPHIPISNLTATSPPTKPAGPRTTRSDCRAPLRRQRIASIRPFLTTSAATRAASRQASSRARSTRRGNRPGRPERPGLPARTRPDRNLPTGPQPQSSADKSGAEAMPTATGPVAPAERALPLASGALGRELFRIRPAKEASVARRLCSSQAATRWTTARATARSGEAAAGGLSRIRGTRRTAHEGSARNR
jgi:hypothetical protein